jgi:hypothetical protein
MLSKHPDARLRSMLLENWMAIKGIRLIPPYPPQWPDWHVQRERCQILPLIPDDLIQEFYMDSRKFFSGSSDEENFESVFLKNLARQYFSDLRVEDILKPAHHNVFSAPPPNPFPSDHYSHRPISIPRPTPPERKFLVMDANRAMGFVTNCGPEGLHQKALEKFGPPPEGLRRRCVPQSIAEAYVWELAELTLDD